MRPESGDWRIGWQRRLRPLLVPVAWGYSGIQSIRRLAYRRRWLAAWQSETPVVSVGSLLAGGSGKTPFVVHLADRLSGHRVAVLSRGYGGRARRPAEVKSDDDPRHCGDEPLLLARTTSASIWIGRDRARLARRLGAEYDLFILDDGYQHLRLGRSLNICLVPALPLGHVLPAGLWREGASALADADFVVCVNDIPDWLKNYYDGPTGTVEFLPGPWQGGEGHATPPARALAFCGIARPERFLASLTEFELVDTVLFRDHHRYSESELSALRERAMQRGADALLTTAKDAVRIRVAPLGLPLFFRDVALRWRAGEDVFARCLSDALGILEQG